MDVDTDGKIVCPHNRECRCEYLDCDNCGWNPAVAKHRLKCYKAGVNMFDKKYEIPFTGRCEVWAKSPEEAAEKARRGDTFTIERDFGDPVCQEDDDDEVE